MRQPQQQVMDTLADYLAGITWVARVLQIGEQCVRRRADAGQIPMIARLPDGSRLFRRSVIEKMAAARRKADQAG